MNKKLTAFLAAWLLIALNFAQAQTNTAKISGGVLDNAGKPVNGATVILLTAKDSAVVKTALTNPDGSFAFENLKENTYRVQVMLIEYKNYLSALAVVTAQQPVVLPNIRLTSDSKALKEVTVSSQRPMIEHLIDRTIVNVDALISNAGGTVMDVLEKSPGVQVDQNGAISLQGKSDVKIFIDDKPTYLSGDDLANYLRALPSSTIERVELMSTPPARYDASGNAGVINIRTKRIKDAGFNGSLTSAYLQGVYGRTNEGLNLNYRHNKINVALGLGYNRNNGFNQVNLNRYFDQSITGIAPDFIQNSFVRRQANSYSARLNIDYNITGKTILGIGLTGLLTAGENHNLDTSRLSTQNQLDSSIIADNYEHRQFKNGGINLNYRHAYNKKGTELSADLDYITYHTQINQDFTNNSYFPNGMLYYQDILTGNLPANISIYAVKADYTHPLVNGAKLSTGFKTSYTITDNIADYFNTTGQFTIPDYNKTNHFIYKENINAAYINASQNFKRVSIQAGLRFESTIASGHQLGNAQKPDSSFSRNYNAFFPTFFVEYRLDSTGKQRITIKYGRRVNRPYYADLNPFLSQLDKFTYNEGNPYLLPSYSDNYEVDYNFNGIATGISYSHIKNKTDGLVQVINGYYYSMPGNIGNTYVVNFEIDGGFNPAKWFNVYAYSMLKYQRTITNFYTGPLDTHGVEFFINPVLTFKPGNNWTIQADGYYQSKMPSEQFIDASKKAVNLAVSKKLSGGITLKLAANDIFHTVANSWEIGYLAGAKANYSSINDSRNIVFALSYGFGKTINNQRKHEDTGAKSEQDRVKN